MCVAASTSQATIVTWTFKGITEHYFGDAPELTPFKLEVRLNTKTIAAGPQWDGPNTSYGGAQFWWSVPPFYSCSGQGADVLTTYKTSQFGVQLNVLDMGNDCGLYIDFGSKLLGQLDPNDPMTRSYDMNNFGATISMVGDMAFQAISVDWAVQNVPEPSPVALIGAGLAGLIWVRRRKDTREQA